MMVSAHMIIERLKEVQLPGNVDLLDFGTSGMDILHYCANYDKVIFVDAIRLGKPPVLYIGLDHVRYRCQMMNCVM